MSRSRWILVLAAASAIVAAVLLLPSAGEPPMVPAPPPATLPSQAPAPPAAEAPIPSAPEPAAAAPEARRDGVLVARLVRAADGAPAAGSASISAPDGDRGATADGSGVVRMEGLPRGRPLHLRVSPSAGAPLSVHGLVVPPRGVLDMGDLVVGASSELVVVVSDPFDAPVPGARVRLFRVFPGLPLRTGYAGSTVDEQAARTLAPRGTAVAEAAAEADAGGRARLAGVAPGPCFLLVQAEGRASHGSRLDLAEGPRPAARVRLGKGCVLEGRVLGRDGSPRPGARALVLPDAERYEVEEGRTGFEELDAASAAASPDGAYRVEGLAAGIHEVRVRTGDGRERSFGRMALPLIGPLDLVVEDGGALRGTVVDDATGGPLGGVEVLAETDPGGPGTAVRVRADSAADGAFSIEGLPDGIEARLVLLRDGYLPCRVEAPGPPRGAPREPVAARLQRGGGIRGRVLGPGGVPVPFARVWSMTGREPWGVDVAGPVRAGPDGSFSLGPVPAGRAIVLADARGFRQTGVPETLSDAFRDEPFHGPRPPDALFVEVPGEGVAEHDVRLDASTSVEGVVVDATGAPVRFAWVQVGHKGDGRTHGTGDSPTDFSGRFRVDEVQPGDDLFVHARLQEGTQGWSPYFRLPAGKTVGGVRVVLGAEGKGAGTGVVAGTVRRTDGAALEDAEIRLDNAIQGQTVFEFAWSWVKDSRAWAVRADGTFRVEGVADGLYAVFATARGCSLRVVGPIQVQRGAEAAPLEIVLEPGKAIAGRVVDEAGAGVPGAILRIADTPLTSMSGGNGFESDPVEDFLAEPTISATTDAQGRFLRDGLKAATHWVTATAPGFGVVTVKTEPGADDLRVVLPRTLRISGVVVDARTGAPLPGIPVWAPRRPGGQSRWLDARTGPDGAFTLAGRVPGTYTISFGGGGMDEPEACVPREVEGVAAGTEDLRVEVEVGPVVAGRVLDREGRPVAGTGVTLFRGDGESGFGDAKTTTGPDGSFRFAGLEEGVVTLRVPSRDPFREGAPPGGAPAPVKVSGIPVGMTDLVVRVVRGVPIRGVVLDPQGRPVGGVRNGSRAYVEVTPSEGDRDFPRFFRAGTAADGTFVTGALDPERAYDLEADGFEGFPGGALRGVKPGGDPVTLRLDPGLAIAGTLVDEDGKPVGPGVPYTVRISRGMLARRETGADGSFLLTGLSPGKYEVEAGGRPSAYLESRTGEEFEAGTKGVVVKLRRGAAISGVLLDAAGRPVGDAHVWADGSWPARTDAEGRFLLQGFEPGEAVELTSQHRNGKHAKLGKATPPVQDAVFRMKPEPPLDAEEEGAEEVEETPDER